MISLKSKIISGLAWSSLAKLITQVFSWISTFVVIRHLTSDDYGVISVAFALMGVFLILSEFGLAEALIQKKKLHPRNYSQIFTATLLINITIFVLLFMFSDVISEYFNEIRLKSVLIYISANLVLSSFIVIPESLLNRNMSFKQRAIIESIASIFNTIVTLFLAINGAGYWSILLGLTANTLVKVFLFNANVKVNYQLTINFKGFRALFDFGIYTFLSRVVWALYSKIDVFVIGKLLGTQALGVYSVANQIASMPLDKLSGTVNQVAFAGFSQLHREKKSDLAHLYYSLRLISGLIFPCFIGIAAIAPQLIPIIIGEQWSNSIPLIQILCIVMPFKLVNSLLGTYITSMGHAKFNLFNSMAYFLCVGLGVFVGQNYDVTGIALGVSVGFISCFILVVFRIANFLKAKVLSLLSIVFLPFIFSLLMWLIVLVLADSDYQLHPTLNLIILIFTGFISYLLLMALFSKTYLDDLLKAFKKT